VQPFNLSVDAGRYWLTRLKSRSETAAMVAVKEWLQRTD
jgi:LysR family transcriptional regulator of beta-lactamase